MTDPNQPQPNEQPPQPPYQQQPPQQPYQQQAPQQPYQQQPYQQPYQQQPQQPYQQQAPAAAGAPLTPAEDKQWASFAHFGGVLWLLPSLIIFLVFKDRGPLTRQEAKEALNWQITWIIGWIVLQIVGAILWGTPAWGIAFIFSTLLPGLLYLLNLVLSIVGGVKVNGGGTYRYPVALRFIK